MIRREVTSGDGPPDWLLISQLQHAHLAGSLAERWQFWSDDQLSSVRSELVAAIYHHDDGWMKWERHPKLRQEDNAPLSFLEMPLDDSLQIWGESIDRSVRLGPLAAYIVAGHFLHLLDQSESAADSRARRWTADYRQRQEDWLQAWMNVLPGQHSRALAADALRWLQELDSLSLWFCCDNTPASHDVAAPTQPRVRFSRAADNCIAAAPWPFEVDRFEVGVRAMQQASREPPSSGSAATRSGDSVELHWRLSTEY